MTDDVALAWRVTGLHGARSDSGHTYNGGRWTGGGETSEKHLAVRLCAPMGRAATVELDLGDESHGCTVSLPPGFARQAAAALLAAADQAEAEMRKWRDVLDRQRAEVESAQRRDLAARAGLSVGETGAT